MFVIAHVLDYLLFAPVVIFTLAISIKTLIDRRRDARDAEEGAD